MNFRASLCGAGVADGLRQAAKILKQLGDPVQKIMQATGLTQEEVEALNLLSNSGRKNRLYPDKRAVFLRNQAV